MSLIKVLGLLGLVVMALASSLNAIGETAVSYVDSKVRIVAQGVSAFRIAEIRAELGIEDGSLPNARIESFSHRQGDITESGREISGAAGKVSILRVTTRAGGWRVTTATEALGRKMTVVASGSGAGIVWTVSDDWGGMRRHRFGPDMRLISIIEKDLPLLVVKYDDSMRAEEVAVGRALILKYQYEDAKSTDIIRKSVTTPGGKLIASWPVPATGPESPGIRSVVRVSQAGLANTIEYDEDLYPEGRPVANNDGTRYAVLPLSGSDRIWRSVNMSILGETDTDDDYFDYSEDGEVRLFLTVGSFESVGRRVVLISGMIARTQTERQ